MSTTKEQRDQIKALAKGGTPPRHIRPQVPGVTMYDIYATIQAERARGIIIPPFQRGDGARTKQTVEIGRGTLERLTPYADARKIAPATLLRALLRAILDGNLVEAVLDDGGAS